MFAKLSARLPLLALLLPALAAAAPLPPGKPNPQIAEAVREVSPRNIEATVRRLVGFGTRHTLAETASDTRGIGAARRWVQSEFTRYAKESGGRLQVTVDAFTQPAGFRNPQPVEVVNVVATLPGSQPESRDRIYVVSGHYDSRALDVADAASDAPGANDDASGVAAVLELARVMSRHQWDATLVFMAVAGEEQGLFGAAHWAKTAKEKNLDVAGMITDDIIGSSHADDGRVDNTHVRLFAEGVPPVRVVPDALHQMIQLGGENDSPTRELARFFKTVAEGNVPGMSVNIVYRRDRYLRGGDHLPFLEAGFPAVRLTEPAEDFRHQHQDVRRTPEGVQLGDLPEFCDFDYIAQVTRVNLAGLGALALAPAAPREVLVEVKELTNATTLRWQANAEPDLAGYEVVWRDTTAPFWQNVAVAGNVTHFTLPDVSKDNVIFGVRAVDKEGNVSPATFPVPVR